VLLLLLLYLKLSKQKKRTQFQRAFDRLSAGEQIALAKQLQKNQSKEARLKIITDAVAESKKKASTRLPDYVLRMIEESGEKHPLTPDEIAFMMFKGVYDGLFHNPGNTHFENYINEVMIKQCKNEEQLQDAWIERRKQLRILNLKPSW